MKPLRLKMQAFGSYGKETTIDFEKVNKLRGMDIVFVTTAKTDEEGHELLAQLGMPFHK